MVPIVGGERPVGLAPVNTGTRWASPSVRREQPPLGLPPVTFASSASLVSRPCFRSAGSLLAVGVEIEGWYGWQFCYLSSFFWCSFLPAPARCSDDGGREDRRSGEPGLLRPWAKLCTALQPHLHLHVPLPSTSADLAISRSSRRLRPGPRR
jgi:hypothetical protein